MKSLGYIINVTVVFGVCGLIASLPFPGDSPVVSFGFDHKLPELELTSFEFSDLVISPDNIAISKPDNVSVSFNITNTGQRDGDQVAEMFVSWENATGIAPRYKLAGFERYRIRRGGSVSGSLTISPQQLELYVNGKGWILEPGIVIVYVGGRLPDKQTTGGSSVINGTLLVHD